MSNSSSENHKMRYLFARLHEGDEPPSFRRLWRAAESASARRKSRPRRWAAVGAVVVIAAVAGLLVRQSRPGPEGPEPMPAEELALASSLSEWQGPLDFLLDTPGGEFLAAAPDLGGWVPSESDLPINLEEFLQ